MSAHCDQPPQGRRVDDRRSEPLRTMAEAPAALAWLFQLAPVSSGSPPSSASSARAEWGRCRYRFLQ